ncbi:MAG: ribosome-recycling factor [Weeksellaceae bacterium]
MDTIVSDFKKTAQECIEQIKEELKTIRTGRPNPGMLENLQIEAYGGSMKMKLMELATIITEGSNALVVAPFDPSTVTDIEKGILASPLGFTPQIQGSRMIVRIPPLSEEQRVKYTKLVSQMVEDAKNKLRRGREDARRTVKRMFDEKTLTEDQRFRIEKDIDTATTQATNDMQDIKENKEQEIMEV